MENTQGTSTSRIRYKEIAAAFSESAATLLPEDRIRHTLEEEEKRFENASALQISPAKFIGGNTARHCKELLRRSQPLYPLYMLSSLLTEGSLMLFAYLLLFAGIQHLLFPGKTITQPYPLLDGIILLAGILLLQYRFRSIWMGHLARTWDKPEHILPAIRKSKCLSSARILLFCAMGIFSVHASGVSTRLQITLWDALILYAGCALFAGIHNLIFDSHIISFLSPGAETLNPRKMYHAPRAARQYIRSSLSQILAQRAATATPPEDAEFEKAAAILRARLLSFRIYGGLAMFILLILACLCISQLLRTFSLPLLAFSLGALLGILLCIVIFLSCRAILQEMKKDAKS